MVQIAIDKVTKRFPAAKGKAGARAGGAGETIAVDAVTLTVNSGELFFLLGPSGCGKTTLLRMIAGFVLPNEGSIAFDGREMAHVPPHQRDTGMVFQSYALWPHMTVGDNVGFGLDVRGIKGDARAKRVDDCLAMVQMGHLKDRKPNQLSGGQQQRVALARALAIQPKCLLLDEPLSNLDAKLRLEMRAEIRRIVKETGITAIYVTHDQKEALSMADGIAIMRNGRVEQTGRPEELYRHPSSRFVAGFVGESNFIAGTVASINSTMAVIDTPAGPLIAAAPKGLPFQPGEKVWAGIRPEAVRVRGGSETLGANTTRLRARLTATTYLGEMAEHLFELPGGATVKAYELNPSAVATPAGGEVDLVIAPENIMLMPADAD